MIKKMCFPNWFFSWVSLMGFSKWVLARKTLGIGFPFANPDKTPTNQICERYH